MGIVEVYARELLAIQPSQVSSERIFSMTKAINLNRESLSPARMRRFVISAANMKKLTEAASKAAKAEEDARAKEDVDFLIKAASRVGLDDDVTDEED